MGRNSTKSDLAHLTPESQVAAELSNKERIKLIKADRWIGYTQANAALERLEGLFCWPSKQRMPNLLIIGPTNNGKSMIIEKFRRKHPPVQLDQYINDKAKMPVVVMQMPSEPGVQRFYSMLLASMDHFTHARSRVAELEHIAINRLRGLKARIVVIDEIHNVLAGRADDRREFLNLLRFLGNELRIPIVGVGIRDAYLAIRTDDQLENRFEPFALPSWEEGSEFQSLLASFAAAFPLRRPSEISTNEMAKYILARTEGTIGEIAQFLTSVAIAAIESGEECINSKSIALSTYQSPSERRRSFERTLL